MCRTINAFICIAVLAGTPVASQARVSPPAVSARTMPADVARLAIAKANALMGQEEWKAAADQFAKAIDSDGFNGLSEAEQYTALIRAGGLAVDQEDAATAHRWMRQATAHSRSTRSDWMQRLDAAFVVHDYADSAVCIAVLARRWPDALSQVNEDAILRVEARLATEPTQERTQQELLDSLFDARWTHEGVAPDYLWLALVQLQMKHGSADKAAVVVKRIADPRNVLALLVDKRYDALTRQEGFNRDIDSVAATALLRAEARVRAAPDQLKPKSALLALLLDDRQFDKVLAISDEVIARVRGDDGPGTYTDFDKTYPWILYHRARALKGLQRWEDALAQWRKAARRPENGGVNVSQSLNLGMLYAELDRPADALEMIDDLGSMSDYGRMVLETIALMASAKLDDASATAKHRAYLRDHRDDAIGSYQDALMTTGPIDAAADLLIERLRNERWRSDALVLIQNYAAVPMTPWMQRYRQRLDQIIAMPRVQAEINKVGRIETFKLGPPLL